MKQSFQLHIIMELFSYFNNEIRKNSINLILFDSTTTIYQIRREREKKFSFSNILTEFYILYNNHEQDEIASYYDDQSVSVCQPKNVFLLLLLLLDEKKKYNLQILISIIIIKKLVCLQIQET